MGNLHLPPHQISNATCNKTQLDSKLYVGMIGRAFCLDPCCIANNDRASDPQGKGLHPGPLHKPTAGTVKSLRDSPRQVDSRDCQELGMFKVHASANGICKRFA